MSPVCMEPEVEVPVEEQARPASEPEAEPVSPQAKQRRRELLVKIFSGHEEFLGLTPD